MPGILTQISERRNGDVSTSAAGVISSGILSLYPQSILAPRLAGYQAIADECRIDQVTVTLTPIYGNNCTGRVTLYLERDSTAAIVATVLLASDQRERFVGSIREPLRLMWRPQEPADREFELLNPGTVSKGIFYVKADQLADSAGVAIPNNTPIFTMTAVSLVTLRGRP